MPEYILSIETASRKGTIALFDSEILISEKMPGESNRFSSDLLSEIGGLINSAGIAIGQISLICISSGPGSYTGLRVGWATAKGLALASNIPCIAVSLLDSLHYGMKMASDCYTFLPLSKGRLAYKHFPSGESKAATISEFRALIAANDNSLYITLSECSDLIDFEWLSEINNITFAEPMQARAIALLGLEAFRSDPESQYFELDYFSE